MINELGTFIVRDNIVREFEIFSPEESINNNVSHFSAFHSYKKKMTASDVYSVKLCGKCRLKFRIFGLRKSLK